MIKHISILFNFGEALVILGSFLPWRFEGDVISYVYYGFQIEISKTNLFFHDDGGSIVLLFAMFLLFLIKTNFIKYRFVVAKIVSFGILVFALIKILVISLYQSQNMTTDYHAVGIGLILVLIGASVLIYIIFNMTEFSREKQFRLM
ncbi:MAG: hypothetical protein CL609_11095 [Anaerolineaceae bacterium]|nr:hypothetical protein [Anaerolineaceae bacterium]